MELHAHAGHTVSGPPWITLTLLAVLLAWYLAAAAKQHRRGRTWSALPTASFTGGTALLAIGFTLPMLSPDGSSFAGHMAQHVLIAMLAPLALALGAPATLALAAAPPPVRRQLAAALHSRPLRLAAHPVTAAILDTGGMYLLYLSPLYAATLTAGWLHHAIHLHFIAAGYLFAWSIAGRDPAPRRPSFRTRLLVLMIVIAAHGALAKMMYAYGWPSGTSHSIDGIRTGAQVMYYGGTLAELLLTIALFSGWYAARGHALHTQPATS